MKKEAFRYFSNQELMAGNMFGEARMVEDNVMDEIREYLAIGGVVMNRAKSHRWPGIPGEVILQKSQFSWLNEGDPNSDMVYTFLKNRTPQPQYVRMMGLAQMLLEGRCDDFSNGANHYVAEWLWRQKLGTDHWCQRLRLTAVWGGHLFMTDGMK